MNKVIALIGNANSGKTTLFNALTGKYQKTGNRAGVTTDIATEKHKKQNDLLIVDLPGIYSLKANSKDESVVLSYLKKTPPSVIINVVDGTTGAPKSSSNLLSFRVTPFFFNSSQQLTAITIGIDNSFN